MRTSAKKITTALSAALLAAGFVARAGAQAADFKGFPDVPKDHWAAQAVNDLARRGILQGYPAEQSGGKLKPKAALPVKTPTKAQTTLQSGKQKAARTRPVVNR